VNNPGNNPNKNYETNLHNTQHNENIRQKAYYSFSINERQLYTRRDD